MNTKVYFCNIFFLVAAQPLGYEYRNKINNINIWLKVFVLYEKFTFFKAADASMLKI